MHEKRACLVYVDATANACPATRERLEREGYVVCEILADSDDALAAQAGDGDLPKELMDCISASDLCVFLLPEQPTLDGAFDICAGTADQLGKTIVGVVQGGRIKYPPNFDECAHSMLRENSDRFEDAVRGTEIWETVDRKPIADRPIKNIRCQ